eukprot:13250096-Alexandrium_andersonii.AAC.1
MDTVATPTGGCCGGGCGVRAGATDACSVWAITVGAGCTGGGTAGWAGLGARTCTAPAKC